MWRKIKRQQYFQSSPQFGYNVYVFSIDGVDSAEAVMDGAYGRDHYPWSWYTLQGVQPSGVGTVDSLRSAKEQVEGLFGLR